MDLSLSQAIITHKSLSLVNHCQGWLINNIDSLQVWTHHLLLFEEEAVSHKPAASNTSFQRLSLIFHWFHWYGCHSLFFTTKKEKFLIFWSKWCLSCPEASILITDQRMLRCGHMALVNPLPFSFFAINYASEKAFSTPMDVSLNPWLLIWTKSLKQ